MSWTEPVPGGACKSVSARPRSSQLKSKDQQVRDKPSITLWGQALQKVESFSYLGSEVGQSAKVLAVRLKKAGKVYHMWRKVFRSRNLGKATECTVSGQW